MRSIALRALAVVVAARAIGALAGGALAIGALLLLGVHGAPPAYGAEPRSDEPAAAVDSTIAVPPQAELVVESGGKEQRFSFAEAQIQVWVDGRLVPLRIPAAAPADQGEGPGASSAHASSGGGVDVAAVARSPEGIALAIGVAVALVVLVYVGVVRPRRRRKPYLQALDIIGNDRTAEFEDVETLLHRALTAGLKSRDVADARFALAYVRARRERYMEALTALQEMTESERADRASAYLELWLQHKLENVDAVEALYKRRDEILARWLDTTMIVSIAYLDRAWSLWRERRTGGALEYFRLVRQLETLSGEVPDQIANHRIVFGVDALLQGQTGAARSHFEAALEEATAQGAASELARLGLLLCRWRDDEEGGLDEELADVVGRLAAARDQAKTPDETAEEEGGLLPEAELDADALLLRNASLWHLVSLLHTWLRLPTREGLPAAEFDRLAARAAAIRAVDPTMGDPYLIEGLIRYYFAGDDAEARARALEVINGALDRDVNLPEVRELYNLEARLAALDKEADKVFIRLVKNHVRNPAVSDEARDELKRRLERSPAFAGKLDNIAVASGPDDPLSASTELQSRAQNLRRSLEKALRSRQGAVGAEEAARLSVVIEQLRKQEEEALEHMRQYEQRETDALVEGTQLFFKEEPEHT